MFHRIVSFIMLLPLGKASFNHAATVSTNQTAVTWYALAVVFWLVAIYCIFGKLGQHLQKVIMILSVDFVAFGIIRQPFKKGYVFQTIDIIILLIGLLFAYVYVKYSEAMKNFIISKIRLNNNLGLILGNIKKNFMCYLYAISVIILSILSFLSLYLYFSIDKKSYLYLIGSFFFPLVVICAVYSFINEIRNKYKKRGKDSQPSQKNPNHH